MKSTSLREAPILLVATALILGATACGSAPEESPRNLLFIVLDALRADHLGCYGYPRATSPEIDALAQGCLVFETAQSAAPWTAPSLISLMTSLHPEVHRVKGHPNPGRMSEKVTTLAEILAARGYATAAFTEGGYAKADFGLGQGFQSFYKNPGDHRSSFSNLTHASRIEGNVQRSIDWLEENRERPLFLFFHTYEIHAPLRPPEPYVQVFRPDYDLAEEHQAVLEVIERWNRDREVTREDWLLYRRHMNMCQKRHETPKLEAKWDFAQASSRLGVDELTEKRVRWFTDLYDAEIRYTDTQVARLWRALEEQGLSDSTIVVVISDHGEGLGDHGELLHGHVLYEELLRIPLLICVPGDTYAPGRVASVVRSIDVMPTVLDLMGLGWGELVLQGRSLVPLLRNDGRAAAAPASFSHGRSRTPDDQYSVRRGPWRLILETSTDDRWLYDLESDPGELENKAAENPRLSDELAGAVLEQLQLDRMLAERLSEGFEVPELDEGTLRELRALGYVDGEN